MYRWMESERREKSGEDEKGQADHVGWISGHDEKLNFRKRPAYTACLKSEEKCRRIAIYLRGDALMLSRKFKTRILA